MRIFDPEFLESLAGLRIVARRVPRYGRHADQRSVDLGSGIEFRDFRPYSPGDDFRFIDWNIYRRLGRVFLRLFEELEDLPLYLMPDISGSMWLEEPPRIVAGLRATLALAAISLNQHDSVGAFPFGSDVRDPVRPRAGKGRVMTLASYLESLRPAGATDIARSLRTLEAMRLRPGLVTLVSDFFDPAGLDPVLEALRRTRHKLLLVQLARRTDLDPGLDGDVRLKDCETGGAEDVTVTSAVLARYRAAYGRFVERLATFARARGAGLWRIDADAEVAPQLAALFEAGKFTV